MSVGGLLDRLLSEGMVVTDGGWATGLQARGLQPADLPDEWNLIHPDRVESVARSFVEAGSRILLTNTFGANRIRLAAAAPALAGRVTEINRAGARISVRAAARRSHVFGCLGPSGRSAREVSECASELEAAFKEQAVALAEEGVAGFVLETMSAPKEACIAVRAAKSIGYPVVASMTFVAGPENDRTPTGATPEEAAHVLLEAGADIVGANCGRGLAGMADICRRLRVATSRPVWVKPSAGLPRKIGGVLTYPISPEEFADLVPAMIRAGAGFVGGCCGTNADYIRAIVAKRKSWYQDPIGQR